MTDIIWKVEQTLDLILPFVILVLSALNLSGVVAVVDKFTPIIYAALALVAGIIKIWGVSLRKTKRNSWERFITK
jgi:hypothetical protein